jgi:CheY-like chemotaxis protein
MMSHEFRTPLNGVLGMTQAMAREKLSAGQAERLKVIRRSGENLLSILNDLLDLSKIEAKTLELERVDFDLHHLLRGVAAGFGPLATRKNLAFDLQLCPDTAGRYIGDPARISRVLYCLMDNAVKFTREGQVALVVERVGPDLLLSVSDTGIGIEAEDKVRLFESFFQAESSLSRRFDGAGLGLALSQELTRLMGGVLGVTSVPGQGSTFTVRLPLARADGMAPAPPGEPYIRHERPAELRVLAAEDNATNQLVLKTLLMQVRITPTFVANGRAALAAWESQAWDIVLMDIQMPEMDGVAATRAIREREAETGRARTPIVALTANAMVDQVVRYREAGMDAVVPKPIEFQTLVSTIEHVLEDAEQLPSAAQQRSV